MATSPIDAGTPVALPCAWLPDDIIMNIFARLPAKFVRRCRCLSRAWATTLSSDDFADLYHRLANLRHSPSVFFLHYSFPDGPQMHLWSQDRPSESSLKLDIPRTPAGTLRLATLQCRGLVVLQHPNQEINYLSNPSTGQMAALPKGQKEGQRNWDHILSNRYYTSLGLGYDVQTKKHKVVRINYEGCDPEGLPSSAGCEVYVVNSVGRWRPIREKPPAWVKYHEPSVFAQGHVHWLAHRRVDISNNRPLEMTIVSFSLVDHTFETVTPPLGMESEGLSKHELTELDGHLCLFSYKVSQSSHYDIWMLTEHGANIWNLRCRIDMSKVSPDVTDRFVRCWLCPLATINNGSRILLAQPRVAYATEYSRLCTYDLVTGDVEDIFSGKDMVYTRTMCTIDAAVYEECTISFG